MHQSNVPACDQFAALRAAEAPLHEMQLEIPRGEANCSILVVEMNRSFRARAVFEKVKLACNNSKLRRAVGFMELWNVVRRTRKIYSTKVRQVTARSVKLVSAPYFWLTHKNLKSI